MAHIDLVLCPICYGSGRIIAAVQGDNEIAGTIQPCTCTSGIEAITEDGEVIAIGNSETGKLSHHAEPT